MLRRWVGPALIAAAVVVPGRARADDAQALFDQGLGDMKAGRYKMGCALIKRSLDVDSRAGTVFTLAECYSRAGKYASAVSLYDRFIKAYETMPAEQREQQQARADLSRTERTRLVALVAWLTVKLPALAPAEVEVTLDGEEFSRGLFGVATGMDPGPHVFTTRTPGGPLIEQRIDIAPGERKSAVLEVRTGEAPETPTEPGETQPASGDGSANAEPPKSRAPWVYLAAGVGAAGLVTGSITGVLLLEKRKTVLNDCTKRFSNGTIGCTPAGKSAADTAQHTLAPLTTVGFAVGIAGAVATILLLATDGSSSNAPRSGAVPVVGVGPESATVGVWTTW